MFLEMDRSRLHELLIGVSNGRELAQPEKWCSRAETSSSTHRRLIRQIEDLLAERHAVLMMR